ncbi:HupE/UreJ family protein [Paracoccus benzoatiresistens]|uniref:HupE/UreJ family protein n=1 Tax=Paracoccus benzoatiresistens TaxID=2997341 RepID=A0ABT4J5L3_9RHOB|nr:HupE/UreJ family protein [Paracoccus sp. EF6]MCZ0962356.1 HupE/UreJ family protein [Paracoccus sp. EF6]
MMQALLTAVALVLLFLAGGEAHAHALQPGYLELTPASGERWRVIWKVPVVAGAPMAIEAVLPESCDARRPPQARFEGNAYISVWQARCAGGIAGGLVTIDGLEDTRTDVLVRYEATPGQAASIRLTPLEPGVTLPQRMGRAGVFRTYLLLGIDHILKGVDHLMFVFALILLIRDRRRLVGAVTAFTAAHSVSLGAASLGWIVVPAPPVEAVVALSIMFLAAEIVRPAGAGLRLSERHPWAVSFAFGLLHGLGFARALLDIGLPSGDIPLALLAFNLGVEVGQLLFIMAVLLAGYLLARLDPAAIRTLGRPGSLGRGSVGYLLGGIAAVWFVGRVAAF